MHDQCKSKITNVFFLNITSLCGRILKCIKILRQQDYKHPLWYRTQYFFLCMYILSFYKNPAQLCNKYAVRLKWLQGEERGRAWNLLKLKWTLIFSHWKHCLHLKNRRLGTWGIHLRYARSNCVSSQHQYLWIFVNSLSCILSPNQCPSGTSSHSWLSSDF